MTAEEEKLMRILEARITQLILDFKDLESKNAMLAEQLQKTEAELTELRVEQEELKAAYESLKIAKMIEISDTDMKNAKSRLSKLVREVNKCIALLNV
jgi:predicted nuclease with TOPRIM domain